MNTIHTTAPISIDNIKAYFIDKDNTEYLIDYDNSEVKGEKLLVYISNLDIPCDIEFEDSASLEAMTEVYINFSQVVSIPVLEKEVLKLLMSKDSKVSIWRDVIESLSLYNIYTVKDESLKSWVESFPEKEVEGNKGINFVNLIKYPEVFELIGNADIHKVQYYPKYFKEYMFKRKSLFNYWASDSNPLFLLTWGIANNNVPYRK